MTGVRFRVGEGWEGRCDVCLEWMPLTETAEGWHPHTGYRRCAACRALWLRHLNATGERLTTEQLTVAARRERARIRMRVVRGMPTRRAPMTDAERARRYRARRRLSTSSTSPLPKAGEVRGHISTHTQQALDNGGASQPTIEDPNVSLPERAA